MSKVKSKPLVTLSGIIKHNGGGYGFKITFADVETANKYKDMIRWIIISDNHELRYDTAYYDKREMREL